MNQFQEQTDRYTKWPYECKEAKNLSIEPTSDRGAYPFQWKINGEGGLHHYGYLILDGPVMNGSDDEKRAELCLRLRAILATAR
jgi:hypothetical protein